MVNSMIFNLAPTDGQRMELPFNLNTATQNGVAMDVAVFFTGSENISK